MYLAGKSHVEKSIYDIIWPQSMDFRMARLAALYKTSAPSWYRYDSYLVSELDGKVAGSLCGYNELESGGAKVGVAFTEVGIDPSEGKAILEALEPYYRVRPPHPENVWIVEHVAVFPRFRGRGLIIPLLEGVLQRGRERGYESAQLDMLIGNAPAQRAYEKAGFKACDEREDPEFAKLFGAPGMVKMSTAL
jgi:GNAT superfamily N-acetyltransferase